MGSLRGQEKDSLELQLQSQELLRLTADNWTNACSLQEQSALFTTKTAL